MTDTLTAAPEPAPEEPQVPQDVAADWRGVANEDTELTATGKLAMAKRSRKLLGSLIRPYVGRAWAALAIILVDNFANVAGPLFIAAALDTGVAAATKGDMGPLFWAITGFIGAALIGALSTYIFLKVSGRLSQDIIFDLRKRVFRHVQELSVSFHERYTSGKIIARLTSDLESLQQLLESALNDALSAILSLISIAIILVYLDAPLALVVLAGFIPLVFITRWAQNHQRHGYRRTRAAIAKVIVHFVESMGGIRAVQAFRREPRNEQILQLEDSEYGAANASALRGMANYTGSMRLIGNITTAAILVVGGWRVIHGDINIGVLAAYLLYLRQFYGPLDELAQVFNAYQSAAAALEKISGVLEEEPSVVEPKAPTKMGTAEGAMRLENVRFSYGQSKQADDGDHGESSGDERARDILPRFSLDIPAGQVIALVGATGAGKSTLAKLLARFYDPTEGTVTLDGVPLPRLADKDLRRNVVMVTQESFLFSGSVADNIRLGRPDASDEDVHDAARAVGLYDYVMDLPEGFDTDVRRRGGRLSAGQRQLVAFARVFLASPAVIVLDEATSSLDIPGERLVQDALETVLHGRTAVIIAHRLSTVAIADRVLVMEDGRIVEDGAPDDLIAGTGRFSTLHAAWKRSLV